MLETKDKENKVHLCVTRVSGVWEGWGAYLAVDGELGQNLLVHTENGCGGWRWRCGRSGALVRDPLEALLGRVLDEELRACTP